MKPLQENAIPRLGRATTALFITLLVATTIGISTPEPADAHNLGHACTGRTSTGFSCRRLSGAITGYDYKDIWTYYNGTRRGTTEILTFPRSNVVDHVLVCDENTSDASSSFVIAAVASSADLVLSGPAQSGDGIHRAGRRLQVELKPHNWTGFARA